MNNKIENTLTTALQNAIENIKNEQVEEKDIDVLKILAHQGVSSACYYLAICYEKGLGVICDSYEARDLLRQGLKTANGEYLELIGEKLELPSQEMAMIRKARQIAKKDKTCANKEK